jgi:hypothetical protein
MRNREEWFSREMANKDKYTCRNVNTYDDLVVMFHLFIMEVVSTMTNFLRSSQVTSDGAKPVKIMTKLTRWSPNNEPISSQMNHSSSAHEEPMTKANCHHRTTTLMSQNNLKLFKFFGIQNYFKILYEKFENSKYQYCAP